MADLPGVVSYGTVTGTFIRAVVDGDDVNDLPDALPIAGTVTFTCSAKKIAAGGKVIIPDPITVNLDTAGSFTVKLVATDDADLNPSGFTYAVSTSFGLDGFSIAVPTNTTVDLAYAAPVGSSGGTLISRGEKGDPGLQGDAMPSTTASTGRTLTSGDTAKAIKSTNTAPQVFTLPTADTVTWGTDAEIDLISTFAQLAVNPAYWNAVTNPNPTTSSVGYSPRSNSTLSTPNVGTGVRATATASGSFGAVGELIPLTAIGPRGVVPGNKVSIRSTFTLAGTTGAAGLALRWQAGATTLGSEIRPGDTTGTGDRFITNATVPNGADGMRVIYYSTTTTAGSTADYGKTMVSNTDTQLTTYADGDTTGCAWFGAQGGSVSAGPLLVGDTICRAGGRLRLRNLGGNVWQSALMGTAPGTLTTTDTLIVDPDRGQAGTRAPNEAAGATTLTVAANRMYGARFYSSKLRTVTVAAFHVVTAAGADDPVEVVLFDASGTRLCTSGAVTGRLNNVGVKTVTLPTTVLPAGATYYVTIGTSGSTAVLAAAQCYNLNGAAFPQLVAFTKDTSYPSTTTVTGFTAANTVPFVTVRES